MNTARLDYSLKRTREALAAYIPGQGQRWTPVEWVSRCLNIPLKQAELFVSTVTANTR